MTNLPEFLGVSSDTSRKWGEQMGKLRLFVMDEDSDNPEDWSGPGGNALVIAESAEQALLLRPSSLAREVSMERPAVVNDPPDLTDLINHFR